MFLTLFETSSKALIASINAYSKKCMQSILYDFNKKIDNLRFSLKSSNLLEDSADKFLKISKIKFPISDVQQFENFDINLNEKVHHINAMVSKF